MTAHTYGLMLPRTPSECPRCKHKTLPSRPFCVNCSFDLRYDKNKASKSGRCLYCGNHGRLTEEHVVGKWLAKRFPQDPKIHRFHRLDRPVDPNQALTGWVETNVEAKIGGMYHDTVRSVCARCNGGWMSRLHERIKSPVVDLATGKWPAYLEAVSTPLAMWATMVGINYQVKGRNPVVTNEQLATLYGQGTPKMPAGWIVSVGIMDTADTKCESFYRPMLGRWDDGGSIFFQSTWFCVERAVFHVFSAPDDVLVSHALRNFVPENYPWPLKPIWNQSRLQLSERSDLVTRDQLFEIQGLLGPVDRVGAAESFLKPQQTALYLGNEEDAPWAMGLPWPPIING